jgi:hypothetical protein
MISARPHVDGAWIKDDDATRIWAEWIAREWLPPFDGSKGDWFTTRFCVARLEDFEPCSKVISQRRDLKIF